MSSQSAAIELLFAEGERKWPGLQVAFEAFAEFVARRCSDDDPARLQADLYLACACCEGSERAAQIFVAAFSGDIERIGKRARVPAISPDDVRQLILRDILVGDETRRPKLESYGGVGSLRGWVRAVATRTTVDLCRAGGGREVASDAAMFEKLVDNADPELQYLKTHYRDQLKLAFEDAVKSMSARALNTLRHLLVDKLTIDEVAALYGIHRSTAARRMSAAREALLEGTRAAMLERLDVEEEVLRSIIRLVGSQFDLSVHRLLVPEGEASLPDKVGGDRRS